MSLPTEDINRLAAMMNTGRYAEAESMARGSLERNPITGFVWKVLGVALMMQGKEALRELRRASELLQDDPETHYHLGNALQDSGQGAAAVVSYERALEINRDFADAHDALGLALRDLGRVDEGLAQHRQALVIRPDFAEAHNNLGSALLQAGRAEEAIASGRSALALRPDFAEAMGNLANALRAAGRIDEAIAGYRRVLELKPNLADAHHNLGNAYLELKQFEQAATSYRQALAIRPDYADALDNLAVALRASGRGAEALAVCRKLVAIRPSSAEAHDQLGTLLLEQRQGEEAIANYRAAIAIRHDYAEAHCNLGHALSRAGRLQEATASLRRALELNPSLAEAHRNLGNVQLDLGALGDAEVSYRRALALRPAYPGALTALSMVLRRQARTLEAELSCAAALEIEPDSAEAIAFMGEIQADKGEFAAAQESFQRAISLNPELPEAWAAIPRYRRMSADDALWLVKAERLLAQPPPLGHEIDLRYSIGKYFDDLHEYPQAFASYRAANELSKRYGVPHDRRKLSQSIDRSISSYNEALFAATRRESLPSQRPVFIVGMPRAGTTLAEQILASHPAVFGAGELRFWTAAAAAYEAAAVDGARRPGVITQLTQEYLRELADLSSDASRVIDKMPANVLNLGLIHAALPQARVIHIQRNPIDTCLSIYFQNLSTTHAYANDLDELANYYTEYLRVMRHWRTALPAGVVLDVPYEQLIDDHEGWARKMLSFIELDWDRRCLSFEQTNRTVTTASNWQVRQKISKTSAGRWRHYERFVEPLRHLLELDPAR